MVRLARWLDLAARRCVGTIAAISLWILVLLTFADVFGRDVLSAPVAGAYEITEFLMGVIIFAALPAATLNREHIVVDLFDALTPRWFVPLRELIATVIEVFVLCVLAWKCWDLAFAMRGYEEVTAQLRMPMFPIVLFISAMSAISAVLCVLAYAFRSLSGGRAA